MSVAAQKPLSENSLKLLERELADQNKLFSRTDSLIVIGAAQLQWLVLANNKNTVKIPRRKCSCEYGIKHPEMGFKGLKRFKLAPVKLGETSALHEFLHI